MGWGTTIRARQTQCYRRVVYRIEIHRQPYHRIRHPSEPDQLSYLRRRKKALIWWNRTKAIRFGIQILKTYLCRASFRTWTQPSLKDRSPSVWIHPSAITHSARMPQQWCTPRQLTQWRDPSPFCFNSSTIVGLSKCSDATRSLRSHNCSPRWWMSMSQPTYRSPISSSSRKTRSYIRRYPNWCPK